MPPLIWLNEHDYSFPDPEQALSEPNGFIAMGGDLAPERLLKAYQTGIFPWYEEGQPLLWWSPDPRMVLFPDEFHLAKSLHKRLRRGDYRVTSDLDFNAVINACAGPRRHTDGTWITHDMREAYRRLHDMGFAHSLEVWRGQELAGGLYGIALGKVFFGESMFSHEADASKVALFALSQYLLQQGYSLIDCQVSSTHLASLGAREIPRKLFCSYLPADINKNAWHFQTTEYLHKPATGSRLQEQNQTPPG